MNTTLVTVTCLLFGLTVPLASAEGIPVGARVGDIDICYEVLGPGIIEEGCSAPCVLIFTYWCEGDFADIGSVREIITLH